jgi:transposase-like protein
MADEAILDTCTRFAPAIEPRFGCRAGDVIELIERAGRAPAFPPQRRTKLPSASTRERLNKAVKRRADVVGLFPSEASIIRLFGAVLLEAKHEWQMQHRDMGAEAMGELLNPATNNETLRLPPKAA